MAIPVTRVQPPPEAHGGTGVGGRMVAPLAATSIGLSALAIAGLASWFGFLMEARHVPTLKLGGALFLAAAGSALVVATLPFPRRRRRSPTLQVGAGAADLASVLRYGLGLLSMAAAVVHFAVIQQHFIVYWLYGTFFIAVGLFQLVWSLAVVIRPSRLLYLT